MYAKVSIRELALVPVGSAAFLLLVDGVSLLLLADGVSFLMLATAGSTPTVDNAEVAIREIAAIE